jgi:hypothetical protein
MEECSLAVKIMILVNFSHPLTPTQPEAVATMTGQKIDRVIEARAQFDHERPFVPQIRALAEQVGLTPEDWQTLPIVVNPPSLHVIAAALLAELHGRMGYFPSILRLRPVPGSNPPQFEVAEILNLNEIREAARKSRGPSS